MKILTVTIESSITKNLGNYQSTKQIVSLVVELNREIDSSKKVTETTIDLEYLTSIIRQQLSEQIEQSIRAMDTQEGPEF